MAAPTLDKGVEVSVAVENHSGTDVVLRDGAAKWEKIRIYEERKSEKGSSGTFYRIDSTKSEPGSELVCYDSRLLF